MNGYQPTQFKLHRWGLSALAVPLENCQEDIGLLKVPRKADQDFKGITQIYEKKEKGHFQELLPEMQPFTPSIYWLLVKL